MKGFELLPLDGLLCLLRELDGPCQADDLTWHALEVGVLHTGGQQSLQRYTASSASHSLAGHSEAGVLSLRMLHNHNGITTTPCNWGRHCANLYD